MNLKPFITIFITVFLAELGDKTQFTTFLFACNKNISRFSVFIASSLALVFSSLIAVVAGKIFSSLVAERIIKILAGLIFITIGIFSILSVVK